ncbi:MAG: restriction endonuclease subunit S [Ruminiclostridium sp.]|nr:restriction endonuclease subunit S [Ruminiclostridium sp.]
MKPEIKKRIEQLNKGKVPSGYKKTEFGVFSCDWVTDKKLKDIGIFGKGKGIPGDKMQSEGVPCVGYGDIYMKYNSFHFEEARSFVDEETAKESQIIKKGTLLFTGTGETADEIGKCVCYNGNEDIYVGGDIITFVTNQVNPLFLAYQQYQSFSLKKKASYGQGHSVVHIQKGELEKLNVAYPASLQEQSRIAEILMKWDKAIELYEKQIEALKKLKTVYLSVMFPKKGETTPKYRFKGFTDPWEQRELGDLGSFKNGMNFSKEAMDKGYPFVNLQNIFGRNVIDTDNLGLAEATDTQLNEYNLLQGDVLFVRSSVKLEGVGEAALVPKFLENTTYSGFIIRFRDESNMDDNFKRFVFGIKSVRDQIMAKATNSANKNISQEVLNNLVVLLPSNAEQKEIGSFFSQLDTLITLHQRKFETISLQRKVLQQYLLNGIVRIKEC